MTTAVACPRCGGPIHPVAGRCKHCKSELSSSRDLAGYQSDLRNVEPQPDARSGRHTSAVAPRFDTEASPRRVFTLGNVGVMMWVGGLTSAMMETGAGREARLERGMSGAIAFMGFVLTMVAVVRWLGRRKLRQPRSAATTRAASWSTRHRLYVAIVPRWFAGSMVAGSVGLSVMFVVTDSGPMRWFENLFSWITLWSAREVSPAIPAMCTLIVCIPSLMAIRIVAWAMRRSGRTASVLPHAIARDERAPTRSSNGGAR